MRVCIEYNQIKAWNDCTERKMNKLLLYGHGGGKNHGCEAIARSSYKIIDKILDDVQFDLISSNREDDADYGLDKLFDIYKTNKLIAYSMRHIGYRVRRMFSKKIDHYMDYEYKNVFTKDADLYLSIGGDNYCYGDVSWLTYINHRLKKQGKETVLWGCSIEPELLEAKEITEDMKRYSLITARESITYDALIRAGITKNTHLFPDPAFTLNTIELDLPSGFDENNTIGINISPLIINYENSKGVTLENYIALVKHIIDTTDMQIALIPHVVHENNDDRKPLSDLYERFKDTNRIVMIDDCNCMELKGFVSRCRFFIGARTHATIAAYSTYVPTLVVGYSVKAKGIAKDIFGTFENYVLPVQSLEDGNNLIKAFEWMKENEDAIRNHLVEFMPSYISRVWQAGEEIKKILDKRNE